MSGSIARNVSAPAQEGTHAANPISSINKTCSTFTSSNSQTSTDVRLNNASIRPPANPEVCLGANQYFKEFVKKVRIGLFHSPAHLSYIDFFYEPEIFLIFT